MLALVFTCFFCLVTVNSHHVQTLPMLPAYITPNCTHLALALSSLLSAGTAGMRAAGPLLRTALKRPL